MFENHVYGRPCDCVECQPEMHGISAEDAKTMQTMTEAMDRLSENWKSL